MCHMFHRHLGVIHSLQERTLRLGRGSIHLIGKNNIGKQRPRLKFKRTGILVVDGHTKDVVGKKIAGKLDAFKRAIQRAGETLCERSLANSRHILNEKMAVGKKANDAQFNSLIFALNDTLDVLLEYLEL